VLKILGEKGDIIRCYSAQLEEEIEIESGFVRPFLMGKDVHRYEKPTPKNVVIFPYWIRDGKATLMLQKEIKKHFPLGWKYLLRNRKYLAEREHGRFLENWWCFSRPQNMTEFLAIKIMTPDICGKAEMTIDEIGEMYHTTTIYSFVFNEKAKYSPKVYLGILNSRVIWYFLTQTGNVLRGNYLRFKTEYLKPFPIPTATIEQQVAIESLVAQILAAKRANPAANTSALESEIDRLVYELYGLSVEEIAVVEGREKDL
jgi:hypothetical protein